MSDVHIEFELQSGPDRPSAAWFRLRAQRRAEPGHPVVGPWLGDLRAASPAFVVLAGDTAAKPMDAINYAAAVADYVSRPVVIITGNHESYGGTPVSEVPHQMRALASKTEGRVIFLEDESHTFEVQGRPVHVLGTELYTDFELFGEDPEIVDETMSAAAITMNDFRCLYAGRQLFSPALMRELHFKSRAWLLENLAAIREREGEDACIVVVTHHAPIPDAVPKRYRQDRVSGAYASDLAAELIDRFQPSAWVYGHCHGRHRNQIGRTQIARAARGYVGVEPEADVFLPEVLVLDRPTRMVACLQCGWVHFLVTRREAEAEIEEFNRYFDSLPYSDRMERFDNKGSSIERYERCTQCGADYHDFRDAATEEVPYGATLNPIIRSDE